MKIVLPLLATVLMAPAGSAQAHLLKLFAATEGSVITGNAYFAGGGPAREIGGRVRAADGSDLGSFITDAEGSFRIQATRRMDHRLEVDSGDGHVARAVVAAAELPASLPAGPVAPSSQSAPPQADPALDAVEAAVARQILPLRRQLDAYESRLRLHDLLGGLGTIFGLFGIYAWTVARRKAP